MFEGLRKYFATGPTLEQPELQGGTLALSAQDADFEDDAKESDQEEVQMAEHNEQMHRDDCHDHERCYINLNGYMHCHDKNECFEAEAMKFPCGTKPDDLVAAVNGLGPNVIPIQLVNFGALGWVLIFKKPYVHP